MKDQKGSAGLTRRDALKRMAQGAAAAALMPRLLSEAMGRVRVVRVEADRVWVVTLRV